MAKKKQSDDDTEPTFEASLAELEQIVGQLEAGKLGLSDALSAYERGVQRLKGCYEVLRHAERRIELVQSIDAAGRAKTAPLEDDDSDDLAEKSAARSRRRSSRGPNADERGDDGGLF
jgi:exodeoxyribonuclease VII small subunit